MAEAQAPNWVTFDSDNDDGDEEEEALSFSNLLAADPDKENTVDGSSSPAKDEHFEFRVSGRAAGHSSEEPVDMCAAEDVFLDGQLLPLGLTQSVSRSDSTASLSFESSSCVSRSISLNSCGSSSDGPPLRRIRSSPLYVYPSPSPRVTPTRRNCAGGIGGGARRSTGSAPPAGWGLLRLGVVMAPEMELQDIRLRRAGAGPRLVTGGSVMDRQKRGGWRLLVGGGLIGCKCSAEDAVSGKAVTEKMKKKEGRSRVLRLMERRERIVEWLEVLSLGKEPLIN